MLLDKTKEQPGAKYNVLNDYRSYTPVFTLACLGKTALSNPESYKQSSLDFVILRSGGKNKGFNVNASQGVVSVGKSEETVDAKKLIEGFNAESPGRFDMYIDNVEMDCVLTPGEKNGNSTALSIKFDVFEPYSLNGFIEALHVSAVSAGFNSYIEASYLLKMEFMGYKDGEGFSAPESIPNASRYYVFTFTGVEVSVTEQGTKYSCSGVPTGDMALSEPDKLLTDIKMSGKSVKEVLNGLFESINSTLKNRSEEEKGKDKGNNRDEYFIRFPEPAASGEKITLTPDSNNVLGKALMAPALTNNSIFKMVPIEKKAAPKKGSKTADPKSTTNTAEAPTPQSEGIKYEPTGNAIQFAQGSKISDAITAVIRDSTYLEKILKDGVDKSKDQNGMIDYFMIQVDVELKSEKDSISHQPLKKYTYVVIPYKVHFSKLPLQKGVAWDPKDVMPLVNRTYNYIYTGKNVDVLNFSLKFNNLYFQAIPPKAGNEKNQEQATAAGMDNTSKTKVDSAASGQSKTEVVPSGPVRASNSTNDGTADTRSGRAGPPRTDPYYKFAEYAHNAILESVDQVTADLDIIGDPFYLVMGGIGNQKPTSAGPGLTTDGTADHQSSQVLIRINFKNPDDIDPATGFMRFNKSLIPYSGIYMVLTVKTSLKDGNFKQTLSLVRLSGQIVDDSVKAEKPVEITSSPKPGSQLTPDSAPAGVEKTGTRISDFNITSLLSRGFPSMGLPGNLSDFAGVGAGIAGVGALGKSLLSQASGAVSSLGNLASIGAQVGLPVGSSLNGINALTNGLRAGAVTISGASNVIAGTGALVQQAGNILGPSSNTSNPSSILAKATGAGDAAMSAVTNLGSSVNISGAAGALSDIKGKAASLTSLANDPTGALKATGIDPAKLAGLSSDLQSKVASQLSEVTKNIPQDVDLNALKKSGVSLANIPGDALQNIPSTAKALVAKAPDLPDVATITSDALGKLNRLNAAGLASGALPDVTALAGKVGSAQSLLNQIPGASAATGAISAIAGGSVEAGLNSIASVTGGNPLGGVSAGNLANLQNSVTSKFGSVASAASSPLTKLLDNSNLG